MDAEAVINIAQAFRYALVMPRIRFTPNLRRHLACPASDVPGATVRAALEQVFGDNPALRSYVLDDQNRLRKHVAVFVDGNVIGDRDGLTDTVAADSEIYVMQALSGG
ncbi:MAG TPA: MoaD/ThiS family protein [Burkholderiales bacterium]|nr:MoaD/ThiS family protein [Burkholderiales bacterium]